MPRFRGHRGVHLGNVVVHQGLASKEWEASGAAQDATHDVLGGLLQPVTDRVLKHLEQNLIHSPILFLCKSNLYLIFVKNGPFPASISLKVCPKTSDVGSDRSTNWAKLLKNCYPINLIRTQWTIECLQTCPRLLKHYRLIRTSCVWICG